MKHDDIYHRREVVECPKLPKKKKSSLIHLSSTPSELRMTRAQFAGPLFKFETQSRVLGRKREYVRTYIPVTSTEPVNFFISCWFNTYTIPDILKDIPIISQFEKLYCVYVYANEISRRCVRISQTVIFTACWLANAWNRLGFVGQVLKIIMYH